MNSTERLIDMEKLDDILKSVNQLRVSLAQQGNKQADCALVQMWDVTQDLQRRLCTQTVLESMRDDALQQAARVHELVMECDLVPNDRQVASVGYACDLAADKIKKYQRMANYAARMEVLSGAAVKEGA